MTFTSRKLAPRLGTILLAGLATAGLAWKASAQDSAGVASTAPAGDFYLSGFAGWSAWSDTSNSDPVESKDLKGFQLGGEFGYELSLDPVTTRIGLEGTWRSNATHGHNPPGEPNDNGDEPGNVFSVLINVWPSYEVYDAIHLYAGGGFGYGFAEFFNDSDSAIAWQLGAGFAYDLTQDVSIGIGYRYFELGDTTHDDLSADFDSHGVVLELGVRL